MADALAVRTDFKLLHRLRVRWAEVDLQKIVFNPHYLMYVDTAIADYWRALALPYERTLAALGGELFVRKSTLEFHASAVYDDRLDVGLRCGRIGNSSIQFVSGIFRGDALLVGAELIYVFADPVAKVALPVPALLRATMLGFEQGAPVVSTEIGSWSALKHPVAELRATDSDDAQALHCVLRNALGEPVATARLRSDARAKRGSAAELEAVDGVAVWEPLRGARWGRAAALALIEHAKTSPKEGP